MLLTKEQLDHSSTIDPHVAEFFKQNPQPEQDVTDHKLLRAGLKMLEDMTIDRLGPPPPGMTEAFHDIPMRDGYMSSLKIHKPSESSPGPLVVLCFGGGFVAGSNQQMTSNARIFVRFFGATVVSINYRLAPEYTFPIGQHDAIDSLKWIAENATGQLLASDPSRGFILGGMSAGACIAACLSRKFQEDKLLHPLTGQWLSIPPTMSHDNCPDQYKSYFIAREQNANAPSLGKEAIDMMTKLAQWDEESDLRYPVLSKTSISEQPRTYFEVDGMDPLRDDGLIYEEMLKEAGTPTKIDFYPGCPHGHAMLMMGTDFGNQATIDRVVGFGWLLGREISREEGTKALGLIKG